jgi:hypothetical protein
MARAKERKRGGKVHEDHMHGEGDHAKKHHGKPGRARGGRIGANRMPLSTAAKVSHITKGETEESGVPSD